MCIHCEYNAYCILPTVYCLLYTVHCPLYTAHCDCDCLLNTALCSPQLPLQPLLFIDLAFEVLGGLP
jgi:hypothetical protein